MSVRHLWTTGSCLIRRVKNSQLASITHTQTYIHSTYCYKQLELVWTSKEVKNVTFDRFLEAWGWGTCKTIHNTHLYNLNTIISSLAERRLRQIEVCILSSTTSSPLLQLYLTFLNDWAGSMQHFNKPLQMLTISYHCDYVKHSLTSNISTQKKKYSYLLYELFPEGLQHFHALTTLRFWFLLKL